MQTKIYNILVNRHAGIQYRYHKIHDNSHGAQKILSWLYLFILNFAYYILCFRFLDKKPGASVYEEKNLLIHKSESAYACEQQPDVDTYIHQLSQYEIISFDIFDTLIFRPFSEPTDVFYFIGLELGIMDFKRIRMEQEWKARQDCYKEKGHYEITLWDIWKRIEREVGIPAEYGIRAEQDWESRFCYANPFMLEVFQKLQEMGKTIIVISDMYLPTDFLQHLLKRNGYTGIEKLYVSGEYGCSKGNGGLFKIARKSFPGKKLWVHIGDNEFSDVGMAKKSGYESLYYPNINKMALAFRPYDMSPVIGGAYRGIVDNYIYQGNRSCSMEYEYGFIYGGLFVVGYCSFIHEYCRKNQIDKLMFLSRDGDILKQVYDFMYPQENTSYVFWSRAASIKLMAGYDRHDYFRRYLYHKVNQHKSIREILASMELEHFADRMDKQKQQKIQKEVTISAGDILTDRNVDMLKEYLLEHFDEILECYQEQSAAAEVYYRRELSGCSHACAIDIGWAGSGALSLSYLAERVWKLPCEITGIIAGTNTIHNAEPDASEIFLQSGKLVSYLFSQSHNREVMKKHDLNRNYNVYWELLLSSTTRQFLGFGFDYQQENALDENNTCPAVSLHFGKKDKNPEGIREIQKGILDFAREYCSHFKEVPYMFQISGRDAYAPMLLAAGHNEKYLKEMAKRFSLEIDVN